MERVAGARQAEQVPSTRLGVITILENGREVRKEVHVVFTDAQGHDVAAPRSFGLEHVAEAVNALATDLINAHTQSEDLADFYRNRTVTNLTRQGVASQGRDQQFDTKPYNDQEQSIWQRIEDLLLGRGSRAAPRTMTRETATFHSHRGVTRAESPLLMAAAPRGGGFQRSFSEPDSLSGEEEDRTSRDPLLANHASVKGGGMAATHRRGSLFDVSSVEQDHGSGSAAQEERFQGSFSSRHDGLFGSQSTRMAAAASGDEADFQAGSLTAAHHPLNDPLAGVRIELRPAAKTHASGRPTNTLGSFFRDQSKASAATLQPQARSTTTLPEGPSVGAQQQPAEHRTAGSLASSRGLRRDRASRNPSSPQAVATPASAVASNEPQNVRLEIRDVARHDRRDRRSPSPEPLAEEPAVLGAATTDEAKRYAPPFGHPDYENTEDKTKWLTKAQMDGWLGDHPPEESKPSQTPFWARPGGLVEEI